MNTRVKELRLILGLSKEEFGAKLGVTNAAISRIESGTRRVTKHMLLSISRVYGTSYYWLTTGKGSIFVSDNVMLDMHDRIKQLRLALNLTQEEFGIRLGLTKSSVSKIEKAINGTTEQTLRSMCREFGASYLWLIAGEGAMFETSNVVDLKDRIKQLRRSMELTQEEFGKRIGLAKSGISRIESGTTGTTGTTEQTLRSMCREFGASYLWLTTGEGPMFEPGGDDAALHVMVDRVMASENERVKQIFKNLGDFTEDDWNQLNALLDKLLAGMRPWEDEKED